MGHDDTTSMKMVLKRKVCHDFTNGNWKQKFTNYGVKEKETITNLVGSIRNINGQFAISVNFWEKGLVQ